VVDEGSSIRVKANWPHTMSDMGILHQFWSDAMKLDANCIIGRQALEMKLASMRSRRSFALSVATIELPLQVLQTRPIVFNMKDKYGGKMSIYCYGGRVERICCQFRFHVLPDHLIL
jgi:hypothetical protein